MATSKAFTTTLAAVRLRAVHMRPYFASALFAMHLVVEDRQATMAVDRSGRIYVNQKFVESITIEQAAWVLIHELGHWLRKHGERAEQLLKGASDEEMAIHRAIGNIATDCELNDDLVAEGAHLPGDYVVPKKYGLPDGKLWEEYYALLRKQVKPKGAPCDCGSGAHGQKGDYELPSPGGSGGGDKDGPDGGKGSPSTSVPGLGEAEGDLLRKQVAQEIRSAATRGTVPAGWKRWADTVLEPPTVPWQKELRALVSNAMTMARGCHDYSYSKPSRRGSFAGVIQPAMVRPDPDAAVVIDTSGSMGDDLLASALREIQGILRACGQRRIPVLCCDAAVHGGVQRVSSALQVKLAGGGGTDMGVGIAEAEALRASVIIVLTDGETPWPLRAPKAQLVIGLLGEFSRSASSREHWGTPPYAKRVLLIGDPPAKKGKRAA